MKLFVTGGSRGIGRHIVETALQKGYDVAYTYKNPDHDSSELMQHIQDKSSQLCKAYQLDITNCDQVEEVADNVENDFEQIDAVINNAGINKNNLLFSMTNDEWHDVINTNLYGTFYVIRQFLSHFLSNGKGRFISISSVAKDGMTGQANYSSSKAALIGLSGTVAKEYGKKNITSNVIVPGIFETDMTQQSLGGEFRDFWLKFCPQKRAGNLMELSELVLFLSSDASAFVNGQVIPITGGLDWVP